MTRQLYVEDGPEYQLKSRQCVKDLDSARKTFTLFGRIALSPAKTPAVQRVFKISTTERTAR